MQAGIYAEQCRDTGVHLVTEEVDSAAEVIVVHVEHRLTCVESHFDPTGRDQGPYIGKWRDAVHECSSCSSTMVAWCEGAIVATHLVVGEHPYGYTCMWINTCMVANLVVGEHPMPKGREDAFLVRELLKLCDEITGDVIGC